ncbi:hypothetical protein BDP27DRAFT_1363721 [Rhodocollybia butyracea]|uniref:Uncharacterized protein n=1 Tax=Rhodocollybia butyracea TaxID=206335 RepID=A0A9P5U7M4_9AGAR|nr:hypothetical protein BDP27DRAFT_1363721 [Rhodocollybia butyracea]
MNIRWEIDTNDELVINRRSLIVGDCKKCQHDGQHDNGGGDTREFCVEIALRKENTCIENDSLDHQISVMPNLVKSIGQHKDKLGIKTSTHPSNTFPSRNDGEGGGMKVQQ